MAVYCAFLVGLGFLGEGDFRICRGKRVVIECTKKGDFSRNGGVNFPRRVLDLLFLMDKRV